MTRARENEYRPDRVSLPGETLEEVLAVQGLTQADFAERTGRPRKTINEIVKGKAAITPETALQFERVLGVAAAFWNSLESNYREYLARVVEEKQLLGAADWLREIPVADMVKRGWIERKNSAVERSREVLGFFGVASPEQWRTVFAQPQAAFRLSTTVRRSEGSLAAWLRQGDLEARKVECSPFDEPTFRKRLRDIRALTTENLDAGLRPLVDLCAVSGVAVVFVPHLKACPVHGAARWISPSKAVIQLSLRYKADDQLWFTFFHEAAHLLLHGKREVFVDTERLDGAKWEKEANSFASEFLIPADLLSPLRPAGERKRLSRAQVVALAERARVSPGIAVGRLQFEGWLPRTHLNDLKQKIDWGRVTAALAG